MGLLAAVLGVLFAAVPAQAQNVTYGGRAYAVGLTGVAVANITVADQLLGDTGALPPGGGSVSSGPGTVTLPAGLGSVTIVTEQANGVNETSTATSQIASVSILPTGVPGGVLGATVLTANTGVDCAGLTTLSSSLATLTIAGQTVPINPNPNTTTTVLSGGLTVATVTFNRQTYDAATNAAAADALVVNFPVTGTLATVIRGTITISHGNSDLTGCATTTPTPTPTPPTPAGSAPGFPRAGALADQAPLNGNVALLAVAVLLLISASTGLLVWRRSI